ncbi:MAG: hypothetical protein CYPHOPRED_003475 [Cyphobasidiales sp. Tagirdzhanova-0007]|nr:MAG: hypothetical protein CYPHOPRED_003475 [Cyphobasidiales sp. Tagirdzhanova-0007]
MLGLKATMSIIDNSGALVAQCVNVLKTTTGHGMARIGDEIVVVVVKARPIPSTSSSSTSAAAINKVRRGDVRRAVVVRTKKESRRPNGTWIRFDDNAAVLLNNKAGYKSRELLGTRVNGVVAAELRDMGWSRICSLAPKVA